MVPTNVIAVAPSCLFAGGADVDLRSVMSVCWKICGACPAMVLPGNARTVDSSTDLEINKLLNLINSSRIRKMNRLFFSEVLIRNAATDQNGGRLLQKQHINCLRKVFRVGPWPSITQIVAAPRWPQKLVFCRTRD